MEKIKPIKIDKIVAAIEKGFIVAIPSDTSYGLACNLENPSAVLKIYKIKRRSDDKQISCFFKNIEQIKKWADISNWQENILQKNLPGPFTFILEKNSDYPIKDQEATVGARIPDLIFITNLLQELIFPITATSVNISGEPPLYDSDEILKLFENEKYKPDFVVDYGSLVKNPPSAVIDLRQDKITTIRKGIRKITVDSHSALCEAKLP